MSIDMELAPPLIVAPVYSKGNTLWGLRLLLVALDISAIPHISPMDRNWKHVGDKEEPNSEARGVGCAIAKMSRLMVGCTIGLNVQLC